MGRITETTFVVVDIETTGFDPARDDVLEVAAMRLAPDGGREVFSTPVRWAPAREKDPRELVGGLRNIPASELVDAPMLPDVLVELGRFMDGAQPVAHYASFEQRFLAPKGMPIGASVCTVKLGRTVIPLRSYKLELLAAAMGCPQVPNHRALTDVEVTAWVLGECLVRGGWWAPGRGVDELLGVAGVVGGRQ